MGQMRVEWVFSLPMVGNVSTLSRTVIPECRGMMYPLNFSTKYIDNNQIKPSCLKDLQKIFVVHHVKDMLFFFLY